MGGRRQNRHRLKKAFDRGAGPELASAGPGSSPSAERSGLKRGLFVWAALLLPVALWTVLELGLRWANVGHEARFFRLYRAGWPAVWVENPEFGRRFFPRRLVRAPQALRLEIPKPADTVRIFILGESAALGDPRPRYGAWRYLQVLLEERFPGVRFEVINTAMTAINSHAIREIARDLERMQGDIWVIYMGNNEMVGPFGAATVFGVRAPPLWLARLGIELQELRSAQLIKRVWEAVPVREEGPVVWEGMAMFLENTVPPEDPRRARVYRSFSVNLDAILQSARRAGAAVVLSTVAVNLRDCPPFRSEEPRWESPAARQKFLALLDQGARAMGEGRVAEALRYYREAVAVAPQHAEAHYRLAEVWLALGRDEEAGEHFARACDLDTLPFRADGRINDVVRRAAERASDRVRLCDAALALGGGAPAGVPGEESFYEHVHLNFDGNYRLARLWADSIRGVLPLAVQRRAGAEWLSQAECERRLGLTDWNRRSVFSEMLQRMQQPPFAGRWGHDRHLARLREQLAATEERMRAADRELTRAVYASALARRPEDPALHENYAEFLEAVGERERALEHRKLVCELLPHNYFGYYCLGTLLKEMRHVAEAREALEMAARLQPGLADVQVELGSVLAAQQQWESARRALSRARRLDPTHPRAPLLLGAVLNQMGRAEEAWAEFERAVRLDPGSAQARLRLGECLLRLGRWREAVDQLEEAIRLEPDLHRARLNLAVAWLQLGDQGRARQEIEAVLARAPGHPDALRLRAELARPGLP